MIILLWAIVVIMVGVVLAVGLFFSAELYALVRNGGIPYVPLRSYQVAGVMKAIPVTDRDVVYDLGCGDGRILRAFINAGAGKAIGFEINVAAYLLGRVRQRRYANRISLYRKNFFQESWKDATVVFVYLLPRIIPRLTKKFDQDLVPGTRVVSYGFPLTGWKEPVAVHVINPDTPDIDRIFEYIV